MRNWEKYLTLCNNFIYENYEVWEILGFAKDRKIEEWIAEAFIVTNLHIFNRPEEIDNNIFFAFSIIDKKLELLDVANRTEEPEFINNVLFQNFNSSTSSNQNLLLKNEFGKRFYKLKLNNTCIHFISNQEFQKLDLNTFEAIETEFLERHENIENLKYVKYDKFTLTETGKTDLNYLIKTLKLSSLFNTSIERFESQNVIYVKADSINQPSPKIFKKYDLQGNFICEGDINFFIREGFRRQVVLSCAVKNSLTHKKYIFRFQEDELKPENLFELVKPKLKKEPKPKVKVIKEPKPKVKVIKEPKPKVKVIKEPKPKVIKEPKPKVIKEPKVKVIKEPKVKVIKEPKVKVIKEPKPKVIKEPKPRKLINQYDLQGNFVKQGTYKNFVKEGFDKSSIYHVCNLKLKTHKNYIFRNAGDELKIEDLPKPKVKIVKEPKPRKLINQYDREGNFIKSGKLSDFIEAGFDYQCLRLVCKEINKTHKGFVFRYA